MVLDSKLENRDRLLWLRMPQSIPRKGDFSCRWKQPMQSEARACRLIRISTWKKACPLTRGRPRMRSLPVTRSRSSPKVAIQTLGGNKRRRYHTSERAMSIPAMRSFPKTEAKHRISLSRISTRAVLEDKLEVTTPTRAARWRTLGRLHSLWQITIAWGGRGGN